MEIDQKDDKPELEIKNLDDNNKKNLTVADKKPKFIVRLKKFWAKKNNRLLTEAIIGLVIIISVGAILFRWYQEQGKSSNSTNNQTKTKPADAKIPSILTGMPVDPEKANRHPLGIIIENHTDARPQSGLSQADIVYEAIAEGGITRFLALFSSQDAAKVGPIRSARTYYVDFAREYNAFFAHVGGNFDALEQIKAQGIFDLDQFQNSAYYERDTKKGLSSEHTVYSSTDKLYQAAAKKNYSTANSFSPFKFKADAVNDSRPASQKVTVNFGSNQYTSQFSYDPATNNYLRSIGGSPDVDRQSGQRITPKNLILEEVNRSLTTTKINEKGYKYNTSGTGTATIFQDGKMVKGTWKKNNPTDRTIYSDAAGNEIILNPGQTWIAIVHPDIKITIE